MRGWKNNYGDYKTMKTKITTYSDYIDNPYHDTFKSINDKLLKTKYFTQKKGTLPNEIVGSTTNITSLKALKRLIKELGNRCFIKVTEDGLTITVINDYLD